ncbi:hypothetical protein IV102_05955 [bacterium]|nr:hypothetical protein [bacterium]
MKISIHQSSTPGWPRGLGASKPDHEKNPWQMDRFELQQEVWDADRKVSDLRSQASSGHTRALVGMSVLFTSLGVMAVQSIMMGGSLPAGLAVPVAVSAGIGMTAFGTGLWKRDNAEINMDVARSEARHMHSIYEKRFENPKD